MDTIDSTTSSLSPSSSSMLLTGGTGGGGDIRASTNAIATTMELFTDLDTDQIKRNFTHVRVLHNFRGGNNDELCMKKDDVITLTQTPSGGWWEGTLNGITGWFPANYVTPIQQQQQQSNDDVQLMMNGRKMSIDFGNTTTTRGSIRSRGSDPGPYAGGSGGGYSGGGGGYSSLGGVDSPISGGGGGSGEHDSLTMLTTTTDGGGGGGGSSTGGSIGDNLQQNNSMAEYRAIVIKDIEDSENVFIQCLQDAINLYLKPMYQCKIFPTDVEINAMLRSITEICSVHRRFLTSVDKIKSSAPKDCRIGGLFLRYAPQFKHAHFEYCQHHAKFVHMIDQYKKEICAYFTAHPLPPPSLSTATSMIGSYPPPTSSTITTSAPHVLITSSLSVSFRRLDKYPAFLQELQRYMEENHIDRGDTQRAGYVYREIAMSCLELRRRKEMELEVLLGNIKNFDGLKIETYGNIQRMEPVSVLILPPWRETKKDCYLVLFPKVLMILSVGNDMTSFTYESMLQLEHARLPVLNVNDAAQHRKSDTGTYQLEIQGSSAHPLSDSELILTYVVQFVDEDTWKEWYQLLAKQVRLQTHAATAAVVTTAAATATTTTTNTATNDHQSSIVVPHSSSSSSSICGVSSSSSSGGAGGGGITPSLSSSSSISSPANGGGGGTGGSGLPLGKPPIGLSKSIPGHPPTPPPPPPLPVHHRQTSQGGNTNGSSGGGGGSSSHLLASRTVSSPHQLPTLQSSSISTAATAFTTLLPRRTNYWADRLLIPHPPYRPMDHLNHQNQRNTSSSGGSRGGGGHQTGSGSNPNVSTLDQSEDLQLFNVIDAYCRRIPSSTTSTNITNGGGGGTSTATNRQMQRKLSNASISGEMDTNDTPLVQILDIISGPIGPGGVTNSFNTNHSGGRVIRNGGGGGGGGTTEDGGAKGGAHGGGGGGKMSNTTTAQLQSLATHLNQLSLSNSSLDRTVLYEIYDQLRQIRTEMSQLYGMIKEERHQRKRMLDAFCQKVGQ